MIASGGTITYDSGYVIHTFTVTGANSFRVFFPVMAEVLLVGGGGSGGGGIWLNAASTARCKHININLHNA